MKKLRIATRKSPLALRQTELVSERLIAEFPELVIEKVLITTSGDKQANWSLQEKGGKGLFTKEIEEAIINGEADLAVHSAKDLPTEMDEQLQIAGFLPREEPNDVLIIRSGITEPCEIASSSPRRRVQGKQLFPCAVWSEIRGNVDTRLKKIVSGAAEATFLASAGLNRLGIHTWDGLTFQKLNYEQMVPAVGQGAVALQTRAGELDWLGPLFCETTAWAVELERQFLASIGGGCQTAVGGHYDGAKFHVYHEDSGYHAFELTPKDKAETGEFIEKILPQVMPGYSV